ncbi:TPA_asm: sigma-70 family RNA polymerase sigma factor [Listeria monocytogenes]|uniref:sigma-70 family RNA polymerase sigma factor n=1 Tax=Listeria monocytogenes TaxID=1639 RepID=UPI000E6CCAEF|nr:sigma-70 family RNA polymerase sigma factor [Listeria monocytogenes]EAC3466956.1 sigma-70 family RNA polymerase sigma factor [Listeria monocytogenes]EAD4207764.1 sigma-70 family RNA polymerase sigma factor [Listeria monocytogenes]EAE0130698.1 sigma-70 family RNA polymerase sigma factor [Listeria monocytogenes]EAE0145735.1 sigma-70 family RNA polymerase sigma factor [Listeria monocytogenes]EAE2799092.1 sigma-70 family RNA polymerase sigma factor [Listeria monocytogenes]
MKDLPNEKIEAQLTKYFHKVICNAASNYYKKKFHQTKKEHLTENFFDSSMGMTNFEEETLTLLMMKESPISIFNGNFHEVSNYLNSREKQFLIEKFVLEKTDEEIGRLFGISRQAVTNRKHRLYKKLREWLNEDTI